MDTNMGKEGLLLVHTNDVYVHSLSRLSGIPEVLIGFYYMSPDSLKVLVICLIDRKHPLCSITDFDTLSHHHLVTKIEVFSSTTSEAEFRNLVCLLQTETNMYIPFVEDEWKFLDCLDSVDISDKRSLVRSIYESRYYLFSKPFTIYNDQKPVSKQDMAFYLRNKVMYLAEMVYEMSLSEVPSLSSAKDDNKQLDLLVRVHSEIYRGTLDVSQFTKDLSMIVGRDLPTIRTSRFLSESDLTTTADDVKSLIQSIIDDTRPTLDFISLVRVYNNLANGETIDVSGKGVSWPVLCINSSSDMIDLTLRNGEEITLPLYRPSVDLTTEEIREVLLFIEGLSIIEQAKYSNIKEALVQRLKALS